MYQRMLDFLGQLKNVERSSVWRKPFLYMDPVVFKQGQNITLGTKDTKNPVVVVTLSISFLLSQIFAET